MWLKFFMDFLADESKHFLLAFGVGYLVYLLISIILSALCSLVEKLIHKPLPMVVGSFIPHIATLAGLACALLSHAWLDGYSLWYVMPLAPHLNLEY